MLRRQTVTNTLVNNTYLLYQCGTLPPAGLNGAPNAFQIPLTSVSVPDTVPYAFLVSPRRACRVPTQQHDRLVFVQLVWIEVDARAPPRVRRCVLWPSNARFGAVSRPAAMNALCPHTSSAAQLCVWCQQTGCTSPPGLEEHSLSHWAYGVRRRYWAWRTALHR